MWHASALLKRNIYRHERFHTEKKPVDAYMAKTKMHNTVKAHIKNRTREKTATERAKSQNK